jgi:ElaB/YqjD/DUF883 family membrane-anchored ribosome-binding protein
MAGTRKVGEKIPLAVVSKDGIKEDSQQQDSSMTEDERQTTISQLTENLKALRSQVEQLSSSLAQVSGKAGRAVADGAGTATDAVATTVRTYPFYAVMAASAAAFLLGRLTVSPERGVADRAYDRLHDLAGRLQPYIVEAMRATKVR